MGNPQLNIARHRIGTVARLTGLSASTIRWYERLGLVLPQRETSGYRTYSQDDIDWLLHLKQHLAETHDSPRCVADMLSWLPIHELCVDLGDQACCRVTGQGPCWVASHTTQSIKICRNCPAYDKKYVVLAPKEYFTAQWIDAAREKLLAS